MRSNIINNIHSIQSFYIGNLGNRSTAEYTQYFMSRILVADELNYVLLLWSRSEMKTVSEERQDCRRSPAKHITWQNDGGLKDCR